MSDPTELDLELPEDALELCQELGKVLTFQVPTGGVFDPVLGKYTTPPVLTPTEWPATPPRRRQSYRQTTSGSTAQESASWLVPAHTIPFEIKKGMQVDVDGTALKALSISPVYSGELVALYRVELGA